MKSLNEKPKVCPNCGDPDIIIDDSGKLSCFECFNMFSSDSLEDIVRRRFTGKVPPKFPGELDKAKAFKDSSRKPDSDGRVTSFIRRIV